MAAHFSELVRGMRCSDCVLLIVFHKGLSVCASLDLIDRVLNDDLIVKDLAFA